MDAVKQTIDKYIEKFSPSVSVKIILKKPIILNGLTLEVPISNKVETSMVQKNEVELLEFLRTELQNSFIQIEYKYSEKQEDRKPYTSSEIFVVMAKKNPSLLQLRDQLGLDTEF